MGSPTSWLQQPMDRFRGIIEATAGAVTLTSGAFLHSTRMHGDLTDPDFPAAHFHRGYEALVMNSDFMSPETAQSHCAMVRRTAKVLLRVGYAFGKDHPLAHSQGITSLSVATELAHSDHERIEAVLTHPRNWSGCTPSVCAILRVGPVTTEVLDPLGRMLATAEYDVITSYTAGSFR